MSAKSTDILNAWGAFFVAHALAVKEIQEEILEVSPLTLHEYDVLLAVSRAEGQCLRYSTLAEQSIFTRSGITRVAKRLEDRKFLERQQCSTDKRGAYACLTPEGETALKKCWMVYSRAILNIFDSALTQSDAKELERLMEKVIQQMRPEPLVKIGSR
ncbi:MAG: MarR family transcriptional regulator [Bdellovibrionales bacterium]|nr:MarR family transcriptional regulator [Bdellovibrionales bacterium]